MISKEDVVALTALARISVSQDEATHLQKDFSSILEYVGQVTAVSAQSQIPAAVKNVMRGDIPYEEGNRLFGKQEQLIDAFPKKEESYAVVRKIISKDE